MNNVMEGPILIDTESESIDISSIKFAVLHGLEVSGKQSPWSLMPGSSPNTER